jgi:hypothetical protein
VAPVKNISFLLSPRNQNFGSHVPCSATRQLGIDGHDNDFMKESTGDANQALKRGGQYSRPTSKAGREKRKEGGRKKGRRKEERKSTTTNSYNLTHVL